MNHCLFCGRELKWYATKYCSNRCQSRNQYQKYIQKWKAGLVNGSMGLLAKGISGHIKRYLDLSKLPLSEPKLSKSEQGSWKIMAHK